MDLIKKDENIIKRKVGRPVKFATIEEKRHQKKIYQRRYMAKKRGEEYNEVRWTPRIAGRGRLNLSEEELKEHKRHYARKYYQKNKEKLQKYHREKRNQYQREVCTCMCKKLQIPII